MHRTFSIFHQKYLSISCEIYCNEWNLHLFEHFGLKYIFFFKKQEITKGSICEICILTRLYRQGKNVIENLRKQNWRPERKKTKSVGAAFHVVHKN